jgi:hypothetical protein
MTPMPHDPFRPPQASLEVPEDRGPTPKRVKYGACLIATSALLAIALNAAMWAGLVAMPGRMPGMVVLEVVVAVLTLAFFGLLGWKIYVGANWARWVFTIFVAFGVVGSVFSLTFAGELMKTMPWPLMASGFLQTALQVTSAVLIFTGEARKWFR